MNDLFSDSNGKPYSRFGVFGPSECGKSTLSQRISMEFWLREKRRTIALLQPTDKTSGGWGKHATIFRDRENFFNEVQKSIPADAPCKGHLVVIEDASVTIGGDKDFTHFFTCLRHADHKTLAIGHHPADLAPVMRDSIQRIFLFLQNEDAVKGYWKNIFQTCDLMPATKLQQYECLTAANWKRPGIFKLAK